MDDIEEFLTTFKRAVEAHRVEQDKRTVILAPQLTGKARLTYAAISNKGACDYDRVKATIVQCYDINKETYCQCFWMAKQKENKKLVELVI